MKEIWRDIKNYEGFYKVSNLGRIRSISRKRNTINGGTAMVYGRILKQTVHPSGYLVMGASVNGAQEKIRIHRAVAQAFLPNPENKETVNHINGIKTDNRVQNLEWATCGENIQHAFDTGLKESLKADDVYCSKMTNEDVVGIKRRLIAGELCKTIAKEFKVNKSTISKIKRGVTWRSIVVCLLLIPSLSQAQTITLPTWVADSLIYETKLSRQCNEVMKAQASEIESLGRELVANGKALQLSQTSNETLSALLNNSKDANEILSMQFQKDLNTEKKKTKRWRKVAIIESIAVIVGLIVLL